MKPLYVKKNGVVYKISGNGMPASYPAENVEYDNTITSELQATDVQSAIDELSIRQDTNTKNTAYGTCDTAGNVKDKVATLSNATNWVLEVGTIVGIRFTYTNTYTPSSGNAVTLNVNNTGAKNIRYGNNVWTGSMDIKCPTAFGEADQTIYYMYDGTYWVWVGHSKDNDTLYNFVGREFRSCNFNDAGLATGFGGDANLMVVNGVYYYNSNGPSTSIGASANDGSVFVHVCDDGYVVQIAQNYETGNIFVRAMNDNVWGAWKKPNANITGNNTVLTTDKTPFLTRQTLNPTGFSGYVREKLVGASYAWNQLVQNGNFATTGSGWTTIRGSLSVSNNVGIFTSGAGSDNALRNVLTDYYIAGHKYLISFKYKSNVAFVFQPPVKPDVVHCGITSNWTTVILLVTNSTYVATLNTAYWYNYDSLTAGAWVLQLMEYQAIDLTLAFGSTIADYLYSLTNNGGITKLRDMGFPIDKYTPYGYGLYSVKTSGKKIVGKNLCEDVIVNCAIDSSGLIYASASTKMGVARVLQGKTYVVKSDDSTLIAGLFYTKPTVGSTTYSGTRIVGASGDYSFTSPITGWIAFRSTSSYQYLQCEFGSTSTTYEPYSSTTYSLGNDNLRGKFDLVDGEIVASGDIKESNGNLTRNYGIVDLGTLTWQKDTTTRPADGATIHAFFASFSSMKKIDNTNVANIISSKYIADSVSRTDYGGGNTVKDKLIAGADGNSRIWVYDSAYNEYTTTDFKTAMNGIYAIYELATPTTEQSTPFADPMSLVGATTEEYIDTRDIPCPVGAERQYMGQSEDVVEIPSTPQSDGIRYLKSYKSGNQEQLVWEGEGIEDVSSYFTEGICDDFEVGAVRYGRVISFNMACTPINGGNYIAVIKTYVPAYALSHVGSINVCAQSTSGLHIDAVVSRYTDAAARIKFYTNETLSADEKIYVSGTYICDIIK